MLRPEQRVDSRQHAETRAALHAAVDVACDLWPAMTESAAARGFRSGGAGGIGSRSHADPTGMAALERDLSSQWLVEFDRVRAHLVWLANRAKALMPAPATRRAALNDVDRCIYCGYEVGPSARAHRVDGHALCAATCYYRVYRQAKKDGTTVGVVVATLVQTTANGKWHV